LTHQDEPIVIDDVSPEAIEVIVSFVHFGTAANLSELAEELFIAAEKYQIEELKRKCIDALGNSLTHENIFSRTVLAFVYNGAESLKSKCLRYLAQRPHSMYLTPLFSSTDWISLLQRNKKLADEIMNTVFEKICN
jgi:hypothetical protein